MKSAWRYFDLIIIATLAVLSLLVTAADLFGLINTGSFLSGLIDPKIFSGVETPKVILILVSLLSLRVCMISYTREKEPETFERVLENTLRDYDGTYLKEFANAVEMEEYLARRIGEAKLSVCDLSWKESISRQYELPQRRKVHKSYEDTMLKAAKNLVYREIFVFSDLRRVEQCERRIAANRPGYSCSYFNEFGGAPRLQFVIVDGREIIFASSSYSKLCAIRGEAVGAIFSQYFDEAWSRAIPLRDSGRNSAALSVILDGARQRLHPHQGIAKNVSPPLPPHDPKNS